MNRLQVSGMSLQELTPCNHCSDPLLHSFLPLFFMERQTLSRYAISKTDEIHFQTDFAFFVRRWSGNHTIFNERAIASTGVLGFDSRLSTSRD